MRVVIVAVFSLLASVVNADLTKDSSIDEILDALDARGKEFKTFTANVSLTESATDFGDKTTRLGKAIYQDQGEGKARIRVSFDKIQRNEKQATGDKLDYELIDGKLIQRNYRTKNQITDQVIRPGEKIDLFKLGQGPFPLPIGQPKAEVHNQFDVAKIDPASDDPANTLHLQLTPKPKTKLARKFKTIDAWVDTQSHMPIRITTLDSNESTERTTNLSDVQINAAVSDQDFDLGKLPDQDWNVTEQAYQE